MTKKSKKWSLASPTIVMECIEKWRNLDLRNLADEDIDDELSSFLDTLGIYPVSTYHTIPFKLWRIRRFSSLFKEVHECFAPPANKAPMNRCNAPGSPVLYTSVDLETPFEELNVQVGEQVYAIKYKVTKQINLKRIVPDKFIATDNDNIEIYDKDSMLTYQILREFVRSEFLRPVGKGTEYLHRISSSMCRVWFHNKDSDGWIYPSVQTPTKNNIALKPMAVKGKVEIEDVRIVRLVKKENVKNHIEKFQSHPFYNLISTAIETDFVGKIDEDKISWVPSTEIGGIF